MSPRSSSAPEPAASAVRSLVGDGHRAGTQCKEGAVAPHARRIAALRKRELGKLIIDRTAELGLEPVADQQPGRGPMFGLDDAKRMVGPEDQRVAAVQLERDAALLPFALDFHLDRPERGGLRLRCRASRPGSPAHAGRRARGEARSRTAGPSPGGGSASPRDTRCRRGRCAFPNGRSARDSIGRPAAGGAHRSTAAAPRS